ncbi:MAG: 7-carboxy-7-deazaguanine synthase QueE [Methanobrevibacter sp.]|jgi:organic radical activating enzyme|nr:7-carboxy-7-deazaguanine synthase QueE [Methanobrevibacter sp.]
MKARISEIFSSIQGEGVFVGRRHIFIRFSGCNLDCIYCDTLNSKNKYYGELLSVDDVITKIKNIITPDLHAISFTGGEPTLYPKFIDELNSEIINKLNPKNKLKLLLETNGSLPENMSLLNHIDHVSLDIKLPEHFKKGGNDILTKELESIKVLLEKKVNIYCKLVILPSTNFETVENIVIKIHDIINDKTETIENIPLIIQPASPITQWKNKEQRLLELSKICGKYMDVLTIPQVHKCLGID